MKLAQNEPISSGSTAEEIAREEGISRETVKRAEKFTQAVDQAAAKAPEIKKMDTSR